MISPTARPRLAPMVMVGKKIPAGTCTFHVKKIPNVLSYGAPSSQMSRQ